MSALPTHADVRVLLGRLRPSASWGWNGGANNDTDSVVWRDSTQTEPIESEYLSEQVVVDAEDVLREANRDAQRGRSDTLVGTNPSIFNQNEVKNAVEELLRRANALNLETGDVLPIDEW